MRRGEKAWVKGGEVFTLTATAVASPAERGILDRRGMSICTKPHSLP